MQDDLPQKLDEKEIVKRYIKAIDKGILKVMSKLGISTYQSYCGAQIFDAVGLQDGARRGVFHRHRDALSKASSLAEIAEETVRRHRTPSVTLRSTATRSTSAASISSAFAASDHVWTAGTVAALQHAVRALYLPDQYRAYAKVSNEQSERPHERCAACWDVKFRGGRWPQAGSARGGRAGRSTIVVAVCDRRDVLWLDLAARRTTTLAIAMNRIGGRSNTGEGGEESLSASSPRCRTAIFDRSSAIKQVASGALRCDRRNIMVNADDAADEDGAGCQARRRRAAAQAARSTRLIAEVRLLDAGRRA